MKSSEMNWSQALAYLQQQGEAHVLITVIASSGSTPRDAGTKMVVSADANYDTIGGGHLEFKAIAKAQSLLGGQQSVQQLEHFVLGASLGQCCGGQTTVMFEYFAPSRVPLLIFGAGHVGTALVNVLKDLPLSIRWIDSRAELFPQQSHAFICLNDDPLEEIERAPQGALVVILTHNHALDYELCKKALQRNDLGFVGVIGSQTKAKRFRLRLAHQGFGAEQIESLHCPVGLDVVPGKAPAEVAISIAAQIIGLYHQQEPQNPSAVKGLSWRELQAELER